MPFTKKDNLYFIRRYWDENWSEEYRYRIYDGNNINILVTIPEEDIPMYFINEVKYKLDLLLKSENVKRKIPGQ